MNLSFDHLPVSFFDILLAGVLLLGVFRGRKNGMSGELISLVMWMGILFGCAMAYEPIGQVFMHTSNLFSLLSCYILAYVTCGVVIFSVVALIKKGLGGKLLGSDMFGRTEYYLGMASGLVRFACIILAFCAVLNARYFAPSEVRAMQKYQDDVYGSNYFPTLHSIQSSVFEDSVTGRWIKENLGFLLIKSTAPEDRPLHQQEANLPF